MPKRSQHRYTSDEKSYLMAISRYYCNKNRSKHRLPMGAYHQIAAKMTDEFGRAYTRPNLRRMVEQLKGGKFDPGARHLDEIQMLKDVIHVLVGLLHDARRGPGIDEEDMEGDGEEEPSPPVVENAQNEQVLQPVEGGEPSPIKVGNTESKQILEPVSGGQTKSHPESGSSSPTQSPSVYPYSPPGIPSPEYVTRPQSTPPQLGTINAPLSRVDSAISVNETNQTATENVETGSADQTEALQ